MSATHCFECRRPVGAAAALAWRETLARGPVCIECEACLDCGALPDDEATERAGTLLCTPCEALRAAEHALCLQLGIEPEEARALAAAGFLTPDAADAEMTRRESLK